MTNQTEELYKKLAKLGLEVKHALRLKGLIVPVKNQDGSISFDRYTVIKQDGFYSIVDYSGEVIVSNINLPQTAIVVANSLALGRYKDTDLIQQDKKYGYAEFEEELYKRAVARKNNSIDSFDVSVGKYSIARGKKHQYKVQIDKSFEKLMKLI